MRDTGREQPRIPLWLLDVDGVINACTNQPDTSIWADYTTVSVDHLHITYSPTVIKFINTVQSQGNADVRWLTTWEDSANTSLAPALGLLELPVAGRDPYPGEYGPRWWKHRIVEMLFDEDQDRSIIWTDDDIPFDATASSWVKGIPRLLPLAPQTVTGLTPDDIKRIAEFLEMFS